MPGYTALGGVTFAATQPASILPYGDGRIYAVNGTARGAAYVGGTALQSIGITAAGSVVVNAVTSPLYHYVSSVVIKNGGQNYCKPPDVSIRGVTGAKAVLSGDAVSRVVITTSATNYTKPPVVRFSGGQASGATADAIMRGQVAGVQLASGDLLSSVPSVTFTAAAGVTVVRPASGRAILDFGDGALSGTQPVGRVSSVVITDGGHYTHSGTIAAPVTTKLGVVEYTASVESVTIATTGGGTGYSSGPKVTFVSDGGRAGGGAVALASVTEAGTGIDDSGKVDAITVLNPGSGYSGRVTVALTNTPATAAAIITPRLLGRYLCGVRFVDAYGVVGNLCALKEVNCDAGASSLQWQLPAATESRVVAKELWRTTADQAITLYKVATVGAGESTYSDTTTDAMLLDASNASYGELPILTPEGYPNAYRFGVPPSNFSTICMFADRAWYAVDTSGKEPRTLYFSEAGEPESVPPEYQVVLQTAGREADRITGLIPSDGALYVCQQRSIVRLTVAGHPLESAAATPVIDRGLLNDRCWDKYDGATYIADAYGLYAFDGSSAKPLSDSVKDFWTSPRMDFAKSKFFFLWVNPAEQVVRFHYVPVGVPSIYPTYAICYSLITQAWWTETYADEMSCAVVLSKDTLPTAYVGGSGSVYEFGSGLTDDGDPIIYSLKTGNMQLNDDPKRGVRLTYAPTFWPHAMGVELHYNGSNSPRPNAIYTNPGSGFVTTAGGTQATLQMAASRSALGEATGFAQFTISGRLDDRSAGTDRTLAVRLSGSQTSAKPIIHRMQVEGVG